MNDNKRYQILLTNDDGIHSPGLWAAAKELSSLGFVTVAAPREQASATGRSFPLTSDGRIDDTTLKIGDQTWSTYAVGGTPGQAVIHAIYELMPSPPDLVVSGINYGENVGSCITISGTVGAALEAASHGIPAIAVSLQMPEEVMMSYSEKINFSAAAYFTQYFARLLLEKNIPEDVQVLKIDIPDNATKETPWRLTRLAKHRYYIPQIRRVGSLKENGIIDARMQVTPEEVPTDSDIYVLAYNKEVSVTPLTLDMTSRVDFDELDRLLRKKDSSQRA